MTIPVIVVIMGEKSWPNFNFFMEKPFKDILLAWHIQGKAKETHLTALTGTDTIVVSWGLVLAHKAGLVDAGWRGRRRWAWHYLFRAGTLGFYGCRKERATRTAQMEGWGKCKIIQNHKANTHFGHRSGDLFCLIGNNKECRKLPSQKTF